jgi:hypothetical protein
MTGAAARAYHHARSVFVQQARPHGVRKRGAQKSGLARQRDSSQDGDARTEHTHRMRVVPQRTDFKNGRWGP